MTLSLFIRVTSVTAMFFLPLCLNLAGISYAFISVQNVARHTLLDYPVIGQKHQQKCVSSRVFSSTQSDNEVQPTSPIARRKLIEKAKTIDPSLEIGEKTGSYSTTGWSNRLGTVLTPVSIPGVYAACRPFLWNNIDVGGRMTVIQLQSSVSSETQKPDLFIHSPVALDEPLMSVIQELGVVKHIVSPNYEHVKYAKMWSEAFPDANMWGCPGLMEREPNVRWTGEIPFGCRPSGYQSNNVGAGGSKEMSRPKDMWDWEELQPLHVDVEVNPFTLRPFFNEVVFFHKPSKSLLTTDIYWNYPASDGIPNSKYAESEEDYGIWELAPKVDSVPFGSRLWKLGMDKIYRPFYLNLMIRRDKREEFNRIASYMTGSDNSQWDIETIIPAHGDIVRGKTFAKRVLRDHFGIGS